MNRTPSGGAPTALLGRRYRRKHRKDNSHSEARVLYTCATLLLFPSQQRPGGRLEHFLDDPVLCQRTSRAQCPTDVAASTEDDTHTHGTMRSDQRSSSVQLARRGGHWNGIPRVERCGWASEAWEAYRPLGTPDLGLWLPRLLTTSATGKNDDGEGLREGPAQRQDGQAAMLPILSPRQDGIRGNALRKIQDPGEDKKVSEISHPTKWSRYVLLWSRWYSGFHRNGQSCTCALSAPAHHKQAHVRRLSKTSPERCQGFLNHAFFNMTTGPRICDPAHMHVACSILETRTFALQCIELLLCWACERSCDCQGLRENAMLGFSAW